MTVLQLFAMVVRTLVLSMLGSAMPQAVTDPPPLTTQQVENGFIYEKTRPAFKDSTRKQVEELGVDFLLDPETERKFRGLGMDQNLLETIRRAVTSVTVQCEPVECEVAINNNVVGNTVGTILTKSAVKPGLLTIKVSAPNFQTQTAEVRLSAKQRLNVPKFTLELLTGGLAVACKPAPVCEITIKGSNNGFAKSGQTSQQRFTVQGLSYGEYQIEAKAPPAYFPKTSTVWVSSPELRPVDLELDEDPWGSKTDLQAFDAVLGSLGGKEILNVGKQSRSSARMRLVGDPPSIGLWNAQVIESVVPNRFRWEMLIVGSKWNVTYDGAKVISDGDKKKYSGTEFAQELEHSIRLFSTMRLPVVLSLIFPNFNIRKGPNLVLIAESRLSAGMIEPEDRYTFQLNADFSPKSLLHEHLTAPRSREEMEFGQYKSIGQDLKLPHVVILRYPDRPKHEHIFQYDKIEINVPVREEQSRR